MNDVMGLEIREGDATDPSDEKGTHKATAKALVEKISR